MILDRKSLKERFRDETTLSVTEIAALVYPEPEITFEEYIPYDFFRLGYDNWQFIPKDMEFYDELIAELKRQKILKKELLEKPIHSDVSDEELMSFHIEAKEKLKVLGFDGVISFTRVNDTVYYETLGWNKEKHPDTKVIVQEKFNISELEERNNIKQLLVDDAVSRKFLSRPVHLDWYAKRQTLQKHLCLKIKNGQIASIQKITKKISKYPRKEWALYIDDLIHGDELRRFTLSPQGDWFQKEIKNTLLAEWLNLDEKSDFQSVNHSQSDIDLDQAGKFISFKELQNRWGNELLPTQVLKKANEGYFGVYVKILSQTEFRPLYIEDEISKDWIKLLGKKALSNAIKELLEEHPSETYDFMANFTTGHDIKDQIQFEALLKQFPQVLGIFMKHYESQPENILNKFKTNDETNPQEIVRIIISCLHKVIDLDESIKYIDSLIQENRACLERLTHFIEKNPLLLKKYAQYERLATTQEVEIEPQCKAWSLNNWMGEKEQPTNFSQFAFFRDEGNARGGYKIISNRYVASNLVSIENIYFNTEQLEQFEATEEFQEWVDGIINPNKKKDNLVSKTEDAAQMNLNRFFPQGCPPICEKNEYRAYQIIKLALNICTNPLCITKEEKSRIKKEVRKDDNFYDSKFSPNKVSDCKGAFDDAWKRSSGRAIVVVSDDKSFPYELDKRFIWLFFKNQELWAKTSNMTDSKKLGTDLVEQNSSLETFYAKWPDIIRAVHDAEGTGADGKPSLGCLLSQNHRDPADKLSKN
jgi:hypothetical protein